MKHIITLIIDHTLRIMIFLILIQKSNVIASRDTICIIYLIPAIGGQVLFVSIKLSPIYFVTDVTFIY